MAKKSKSKSQKGLRVRPISDKKMLEAIGGNSYLTELANFVPTASHISNYAKIVQRKRILRNLDLLYQ